MKKILSLEYNSTRDKLKYYEYGRSIQRMIEHAKSIENREERQSTIEAIVEIINQLNPQSKNIQEYKQKLWRHVFVMANNELDVDHPFDSLPTEEEQKLKPQNVHYPQHEFKWKHYGFNIRIMIEKALNLEEGPIKRGFVDAILSYMKLSYRNWNKENFVSDDIIISDLNVMSNGKLSVSDDHTIYLAAMKANQPNANQTVFKTQKKKKQIFKKPQQPGNSSPNNSNNINKKFKKK